MYLLFVVELINTIEDTSPRIYFRAVILLPLLNVKFKLWSCLQLFYCAKNEIYLGFVACNVIRKDFKDERDNIRKITLL